ncbi:uncharacterized protein [Lepisosteus oculatus]|uniref:uncharacterized protein n=1 Tax=Lepisosteus oculatus TaxID=7918 RepID=UPI0037238988
MGSRQGTPWTGLQSSTGHIHTRTLGQCTGSQLTYHYVFGLWEETRASGGNPQEHGEKTQAPCRQRETVLDEHNCCKSSFATTCLLLKPHSSGIHSVSTADPESQYLASMTAASPVFQACLSVKPHSSGIHSVSTAGLSPPGSAAGTSIHPCPRDGSAPVAVCVPFALYSINCGMLHLSPLHWLQALLLFVQRRNQGRKVSGDGYARQLNTFKKPHSLLAQLKTRAS